MNGSSWAKFRELIATRYTDVTVVSIAANGKDMSFSSDTGIAECLIIGRKLRRDEKGSLRAKFAFLASQAGRIRSRTGTFKGHGVECRNSPD